MQQRDAGAEKFTIPGKASNGPPKSLPPNPPPPPPNMADSGTRPPPSGCTPCGGMPPGLEFCVGDYTQCRHRACFCSPLRLSSSPP